ncbi:MAG TPA: peptidylprolyl isomerase [Thermoanaerobaculia bacterium]|nr:peptidylprolyl isomerase [Thermoanaerobaculia bacterium]
MKKTTLILMGLALSASVVMAQEKTAATTTAKAATTTTATAATGDPVIITAGDIVIKQSEFESALKTLPAEYQSYAMGPGKKQFAEDYLRMKMLAQMGYKAGLANDPSVQQQLALMKDNLVANAQLKEIDNGIALSDADLQKIYDENKKDYEQVKARHILIAFKGSPAAQAGKPELTEEQAKAKAEDIKKQLAAGAKFEDLAKKESDDTGSGANGGELGAFGHGQMVPEFEKAAFEAKPGDVIGPVRTQYGYHVIKVDAHEYTPFATVKATIEKKEHQKALQAKLDALKTDAKPVFSDAYFVPPAPPAAAAPAESAKPAPATTKPASEKHTEKKPAKP